ncbi:membrane protein insertase YidC [candidate division KSB1 bacterium]|nr:membrane protein insertase YidC [candidate division KSB1 bacterium]RQW00687.1 MAG: membrane protein insertase YidC [candidate division KSB1 bacterium]
MDFDRKTIFAFILIGLILILANTSFYQKVVDPKGYEIRQQRKKQIAQETAQRQQRDDATIISELEEQPIEEEIIPETADENDSVSLIPSTVQQDEKVITIETELYKATFSSIGASLQQWELKKYSGPDDQPVRLFRSEEYGTMSLGFKTRIGDSLSTARLGFTSDSKSSITLTGDESYTLDFELPIGDERKIRKIFTFYNGRYDISMKVEFENLHDIIADKRYVIAAPNGLASTEKRLKDDMMYAKAATASGGEVQKSYKANSKRYEETGAIDWVAVRTKYFAFYIIPMTEDGTSAKISGQELTLTPAAKEKWKKFSLKLAMPYLGERIAREEFRLYLGPLEYDILKKYEGNLHDFMDFGWGPIRWFSLPILKTLKWMHNFIPNYGVVLLIFALLIKIIVYPLTHKSYQSMQKMQAIQPKLKELQEKHKNDPQKLNQATMAMYKKEGVNPMGGCLPMLIQMPLLFGLFIVFRTTIELRGEGFFLWITDLSAPDTVYTFPGNFSLPLYGDTVNILPLVMGATMFIQQKMTVTDPKQKMMVYFMPIFLTLLFNSFPSGLNLYYALFNALSILQQKYLTPKKKQEIAEVKVPKKRKK